MELRILDSNFEDLGALDIYDSLIWTERYSSYGDFEIYLPVTSAMLVNLTPGNHIWERASKRVMIIEGRQITSDPENGNKLTIIGRSLESILDRRIIWGQTILDGDLQTGIQKIINENVINPTIAERRIDNFIFEPSTDPTITPLTLGIQLHGENLYDIIKAICETYNLGFSITLTGAKVFIFKLYAGADRSYAQFTNPYIVFSPKFENLINADYSESIRPLKNVAYVCGEGEGSARTVASVGSWSGLLRRELYTDAKNLSSTIDSGTLEPTVYAAQLIAKGMEDLAKNTIAKAFEGQADTTQAFKYGEDFFMGDIVQLENEYGIESKVRVTELVRSQSISGVSSYPTFNTVD